MNCSKLWCEISADGPRQPQDRRSLASNVLGEDRITMYVHCVKFIPTVCELPFDVSLKSSIMQSDSMTVDPWLNGIPVFFEVTISTNVARCRGQRSLAEIPRPPTWDWYCLDIRRQCIGITVVSIRHESGGNMMPTFRKTRE
jgi:hypothetical protein